MLTKLSPPLARWWARWSTRQKAVAALLILLLGWWWFGLPRPLFQTPLSTVLEDHQGELLGARIATDEQWRFPPLDSLPDKLGVAIVAFEDRRFAYHPGVDPLALVRAMGQNLRARRIVSGGSTLSMQVVRLARGNPPRTLSQKLVEALLALRLDLGYRKADILRMWATHAPFGGNVVGVEAAAWRYFGKNPARLSWAEAATLAVLPNSPALIHPGRNRNRLQAKRDNLLRHLHHSGHLDALSLELALAEPLPGPPLPLPQMAPHLLQRTWREQGPGRWRTTLQPTLQHQLEELATRRQRELAANEVHNLAILVVETRTGRTLAYVGNVPGLAAEHSPSVDVITAPRSPGSLLKPMLLGLALEEGRLTTASLLPDAPTTFGGFRPENFHQDYQGAVSARQALARSLNVPFVHLLHLYGAERFHYALRKWGFAQINQPASHYGLSLILGGCEVTLWEAVGWYASMARMVAHYYPLQGQYSATDWRPPHYLLHHDQPDHQPNRQLTPSPTLLGAGAGWQLLDVMQEVERPTSEGSWERFPSSRRVAWKTGTSYGFRDAWAVGVTPRYTVGVWVGNADGEGRPGLVGVQAAGPVLFEVFHALPPDGQPWFEPPHDAWRPLSVCRASGYRALPFCPTDTVTAPKAALTGLPPCPYHEQLFLDAAGQHRIHAGCLEPGETLQATPWLVLPPLLEYYYRRRHPHYQPLPPWRPNCQPTQGEGQVMQLVYPRQPSRILVPRDLDGQLSATVFSVAHRRPDAVIYWHLDEVFMGETRSFHNLELRPSPGHHRIVLVDESGNRLEQRFEIIAASTQ